MVHLPLYTALTAAIIMIFQMILMMIVGFRRVKHQQILGDGGHEDLIMLIRRYGNLTENAPMFIAVLALLEMMTSGSSLILSLGLSFIVVRISHAVGLTVGGPNPFRLVGAFGTLLLGCGTAIYLLYNVAQAI
ncbi:MAG: putative membrane protein YecN with MAPEG domain [Gammaproteobacteria bacterium]|jgi:uncharacterized membrane protein YecN with MAPEG domain